MRAPASQHPGKVDPSPRCLLSEGFEGPEDGGFCFGKDSVGETPWGPLTRGPSMAHLRMHPVDVKSQWTEASRAQTTRRWPLWDRGSQPHL